MIASGRAGRAPGLAGGDTRVAGLPPELAAARASCGEAGAIGSPPALINAVTDAIGVANLDMPATPEKVWRAMQAAD